MQSVPTCRRMADMTKAKKKTAPRETKVVAASLDGSDQERLAGYIGREAQRGVRLRPGQALGALFRRGLDVVEEEARS